MCKPYKIQIQTFSLLPIMTGCAGTGMEWCLFLHSPSPGSLGERWGGRKIARRKGYGWTGSFYHSFPSGNLAVFMSLMHPLILITLERGRQASLTQQWKGLGDSNSIHCTNMLKSASGETHGAPVPPPCPSKAKSLSVKFVAPERLLGRGCSGQCSGQKGTDFPRQQWRQTLEEGM